MKAKSKKQPKSKEPTEQDIVREAKSLQELTRLTVLVILSLISLLVLFWAFS